MFKLFWNILKDERGIAPAIIAALISAIGGMASGAMQQQGQQNALRSNATSNLGVQDSIKSILGGQNSGSLDLQGNKKADKQDDSMGGGFGGVLKSILGNIGNRQTQAPATGLNKYYQDYQTNPPASTTPGLTGVYEDYYNQPSILGRLGSRTYYQ